ncbi:MAG: hypothetical protein M3243_03855, partial [Thermoproteota archaeon]|nr:hypothetical protein [Thermoproteota archaeon]
FFDGSYLRLKRLQKKDNTLGHNSLVWIGSFNKTFNREEGKIEVVAALCNLLYYNAQYLSLVEIKLKVYC